MIDARRTGIVVVALLALAAMAVPLGAQGRRVVFNRFGYRLNSVGESVAVSAGVLDSLLRPEPNAVLAWRIEHPTIATVNTRGVVTARRIGYTRLWAISGRDSAAAIILVRVDAYTIEFTPSPMRLDPDGTSVPIRIRLVAGTGELLADLTRTPGACFSLNNGVATLRVGGQVAAVSTGVTYVRCTGRGVTDSVRIEVGQRVAAISIAGDGGRLVPGDTVQFSARTDNSAGQPLAGVVLAWASTNTGVVRIDSATGVARALGPGAAGVVAQFGRIADTVYVTVSPPRIASLRLAPVFPFVSDTVAIVATARDASGAIVAVPDRAITLRSTRPSVVQVVGARVIAADSGSAWVVATIGTATDSILVAPRERASAIMAGSVPPPARQTRDSASTAELRSRIAGRLVSLTASASRMSHSSQLAQGRTEDRAGLITGGSASVAVTRSLDIAADLGGGTLTGADGAEDLSVAEVRGQLTYWTRDWLALRVGYTRRSEATDLVLHRWQFANATAVTQMDLFGGALRSVSAFSLLPWGGFSGHREATGKQVAPNRTSFAILSSLEFRWSALSAAISYQGERFTFPEANGASRRDQFSTVRLRVGLEAGPVVRN